MKTSELRIGNWLKSRLTGKDFQVSAEDIFNISKDENVVEPIPITEEWLLKFGFETLDSICLHFKNNNFELYNSIGTSWVFSIRYMGLIIANYQNIHQLQNLYFSLTMEELS